MAGRAGYVADGLRIAKARQALGLTQADFAERLEIHRVTLTKIENSDAKVSLELLERLVMLTGRSREWLLGQPEQVDPVEQNRQRVGAALAKMADAFDELAELTDTLNSRLPGSKDRAAA